MRIRYGVVGRDIVQVSSKGRRVVLAKESTAQSISVGHLGRWLVVLSTWHAMGETETDLRAFDRATLEGSFWKRFGDDDHLGLDGEGHLVVRHPHRWGTKRWQAWRIADWTEVEGFELDENRKLESLGTFTEMESLPKIGDASPLGRWSFRGEGETGSVSAGEDAVVIETRRGERASTRIADQGFVRDGNEAKWHGEHGGELVHVTIVALNEDEAELTWHDGVTYPWEVTLTRDSG